MVLDVTRLAPDGMTIDALARLELAARRAGCRLCLLHASAELQRLLECIGLDGVLLLEPGGQAEEGKERCGAEEESEFDDPPA
ncbi:MAG: hypothetical protein NVSMB25_15260 [Thermoleophilaceae bacterium]